MPCGSCVRGVFDVPDGVEPRPDHILQEASRILFVENPSGIDLLVKANLLYSPATDMFWMEIINGPPPSLLEMLNSSFGFWGDEKLFSWKYSQYPGYKDEHCYHVVDEDKVAAFTRLYAKELTDGRKVHIWGDTLVDRGYRGKGIYSTLKEMEKKRSAEADLMMTFNTKYKIPYHVHLKDGWEFRELPLYIKIQDPAKVLNSYLEEGLRNSPWLKRGLDSLGLVLDIDGEHVCLSEVTNMKIPVKRSLVDGLIKLFSSGGSLETDEKVEHGDEGEVESLFRNMSAKGFKRDPEDVYHILSYPYIEDVLTVKDKGFAVIGRFPREDIVELRVLDMMYSDTSTYNALIDAMDSGDSVLMMSSVAPPGWVRVRNRVVMWDPAFGSFHMPVSIYDMV